MNINARKARRITREAIRTRRERRNATRALAIGTPQPATAHLIGRGMDPHTAHRFARAFSNGAQATSTSTTVMKFKGRKRGPVAVKLYDTPAFLARLATHRPKKDKAAAAKFAALAA